MKWTPRWHHVTQLHKDGSGWNDCGEASLARAIMEYDPITAERLQNQEWELPRKVADPNDTATIWDLINRLAVLARGYADRPTNGFTDGAGIQKILDAFGLSSGTRYIDQQDGSGRAYMAALKAPMSLCWVDGTAQEPASFPASYFGGDWGFDHLTLWLPNLDGEDNLFNDPLSIWPDRKTDVQYDLSSIRQAMGGAWILPTPEAVHIPVWTIKKDCALKVQPNHLCRKQLDLKAGQVVTLLNRRTPHWQEIVVPTAPGDAHVGWVETSNLAKS